MVTMARTVAVGSGILCAHIRGEGDSLVESVKEAIAIAETAEIPLNISHLKATGRKNRDSLIYQAIDCIESARGRGIPVTADFYPYTGGSTTLQSLLPPTMLEDDISSMLRKMGTKEGKQSLCREFVKDHPGWDNMVASIGWDRILVSGVELPEHQSYQGKSLLRLSEELGYEDPAELVADLLYTENGRVSIIVMSMCQKDVDMIACLPYTALISDALYTGSENPHPRLYGAFPKFLRDYTLERKIMPAEMAIHKMTGMPAKRMGLSGRGEIRPGAQADILVFDPHKFKDKAEFAHAKQLAEGMDFVLLNGLPVWQGGIMMNKEQGKLLLKK